MRESDFVDVLEEQRKGLGREQRFARSSNSAQPIESALMPSPSLPQSNWP